MCAISGYGLLPERWRVAGVYTPALLAPPEVGKSVATTIQIHFVIAEKGNISAVRALLKLLAVCYALDSLVSIGATTLWDSLSLSDLGSPLGKLPLKSILALLLYLSFKMAHRGKQGATVARLLAADSADGKDGNFMGAFETVISSLPS